MTWRMIRDPHNNREKKMVLCASRGMKTAWRRRKKVQTGETCSRFGADDKLNTYLLENISSLIIVHYREEELVGECR